MDKITNLVDDIFKPMQRRNRLDKPKKTEFGKNASKFFSDYIFIDIPCDVDSWIAGGALRDFYLYGCIKEGTDIDVFTSKQEYFDKIKKSFEEYYDIKGETDCAITFTDKDDDEKIVQLIKIFHPTPVDCIKRFDFTCCCAYIAAVQTKDDNIPASKRMTYDYLDEFMTDNDNKKLRLLNINENPITQLQRIKKYIKKGYTLTDNERLSMVKAYLSEEFNLEELEDGYHGLKIKE